MSEDQPARNSTTDYSTGVSDVMESAFGNGLMVAATGGCRSANPHSVETYSWQEWLRGFQAWDDAPKVELEVADVR